jgi:hypothetical protein
VDPSRAGSKVSLAVQTASVHAFHNGIGISASLVALGGLLGLAGIRNPRRVVLCADCAGGQLAGQPLDAARKPAPTPRPLPIATVATKTAVTSRSDCSLLSSSAVTVLACRRISLH